jgi:hypothetical protein
MRVPTSQVHSGSGLDTQFPFVIREFEPAALPAPGRPAALPVSGPMAAKSLPTARARFGRLEDSLPEGSLRGFLSGIACRAGWILSIPRNEQLMVQPYSQPTRPRPRLSVRTLLLPITLPGQHRRRVPEPVLPSEQTPEIPPPQQ